MPSRSLQAFAAALLWASAVSAPSVAEDGDVRAVGAEGGVVPGETGEKPEVRLSLPTVRVRPGEAFSVPLRLQSDVPLAMVAWTLQFDPAALQFEEPPILSQTLERLRQSVPEEDFRFEWFFDNQEGWLQVLLVTDYEGRGGFSIPPGLLLSALTMRFRLLETAGEGPHPLAFLRSPGTDFEGRFFDGESQVFHAFRPTGGPFGDEDLFSGTEEPELEDGVVLALVGDVGFFRRGDANLDDAVDISDPLHILLSTFQGGSPLECDAAADANADGSVDISDPVTILRYLFSGATGDPTAGGLSPESDEDNLVECPL